MTSVKPGDAEVEYDLVECGRFVQWRGYGNGWYRLVCVCCNREVRPVSTTALPGDIGIWDRRTHAVSTTAGP